jgi:hypothetical protein
MHSITRNYRGNNGGVSWKGIKKGTKRDGGEGEFSEREERRGSVR